MPRTPLRYRIIDGFTGPFTIIEDVSGNLTTGWLADRSADLDGARLDPNMSHGLANRLSAYFAGDDVDFSDVPLPVGREFHRQCWAACRRIPRGETRSYADLAELAGGSRGAARAAGQAMRHNPVPIIVPCHRVVAASGGLHGFSGSRDADGPQLAIKRGLLDHERAHAAPPLPFIETDVRTTAWPVEHAARG
ncbi:MAG: methylated-DNA--[protein]-cysteine S-methyltransferase [Planctomycetota bacterium]|jgi:methylated-DNA-[protein]-cysteine S-methyltransferase